MIGTKIATASRKSIASGVVTVWTTDVTGKRGYDSSRWDYEGGPAESEREECGNFPPYEDRMRDYQDDYRRDRGEWSGGSRKTVP
jgi:hypothetical protein